MAAQHGNSTTFPSQELLAATSAHSVRQVLKRLRQSAATAGDEVCASLIRAAAVDAERVLNREPHMEEVLQLFGRELAAAVSAEVLAAVQELVRQQRANVQKRQEDDNDLPW